MTALTELLYWYRTRGAPLVWLRHPTASSSNLDEALKAGGFMKAEELYGMTATTSVLARSGIVPDGVDVREATSTDWSVGPNWSHWATTSLPKSRASIRGSWRNRWV
jgi:hypothetical protein